MVAIDHLPLTLPLSADGRAGGAFMVAIGLLLAALPGFLGYWLLRGQAEVNAYNLSFLVVAALPCLLLLWFGLKGLTLERHIELTDVTVRYRERSWVHGRHWNEAVSRFQAVELSFIQAGTRQNNSETTSYKLRLLHPDPRRTLTLKDVWFRSWTPDPQVAATLRREGQFLSHQWGLPLRDRLDDPPS